MWLGSIMTFELIETQRQSPSILSYRYQKSDTFWEKYRIGIVSVSKFQFLEVSVKYQYRNFHSQKYQYHIGIVFFSLVVSASVSVVILQQRDHCCSHLDRVYSYKKLKISQKSIFFGIILGIIPFSISIGIVSVSGF